MKKRIIIIVSVILIFLVAAGVGAVVLFDTSHEPMAKILLAENGRHRAEYSDGNSLVQVGARLYYSVDSKNNPVKYGLYEITNRSVKRIWWDGIKSSSSSNYFNNLAVFDDSLAQVDTATGQISLFDFDKGEFVPQEGVYSEYILERNEYQQYQTENDSPVLYTSLFGKTYFIADRNATPVLFVHDPYADEIEAIFDFSQIEGGAYCRDVYSRDATVFVEFMGESGVCGLEFDSEENKAEIIGTQDYKGRYATIDYSVKVNNPSMSEDSDSSVGIFVTDRKTKETKKIYDGYVCDYHLLDDVWVYFTLEDYSLWRVSLDGETLEQVF